jgi:DNA-binding winged helix-turn-helix (wHTH) protein/tetratricopeptide (TPR) repeat protein
MWHFPPFRLDVRNQCLWRDEERVALMPKPFAVLVYLVEHAGQLVTQDDLLTAIWPDTHVQPEVLRRYILEIRRVLGDQPESPRFIETQPKRGYRFIADIRDGSAPAPLAAAPEPVAPEPRSPRKRWKYSAAIAVVAAAILVSAGLYWRGRHPRIAERDTILLADFRNLTGDPVFDGALRQGLAVQLEQSPFLSLVSDERIQQTLQLMRLPADSKLTPELARDACQRIGSSTFIDGSIRQVGTQYSLILRATNCATGETLSSAEAPAKDKNHVLEALGSGSSEMRRKLGESIATIQRFDTPLVQATTSSLDALQAYSLGHRALTVNGDSAAAAPFFRRAVSLDSNFAMAHTLLGDALWNLGESTAASESIRKAYDLRTSVSEWEKLRIESEYESLVTNNLERAQRAFEVWAQTYPRESTPRNRLGTVYMALGQHEKAALAFQEALRLNPASGLIRGNLINSYIALNRLEEARTMIEETKASTPNSPGLKINLYRLAFLRGDRVEMSRQAELARATPGLEDELLWFEAATAAYFGQFRKALTLFEQAIAAAERADEKEAAARYRAATALRFAAFGEKLEARKHARAALESSHGHSMKYLVALTLSQTGDLAEAQRLTREIESKSPEDTIVRFVHLPVLRARFALAAGDPVKALDALEPSRPFEGGVALYPAYVRGVALVEAGRARAAVAEFRKLIDHPGIVMNAIMGPLARLHLARALAKDGDALNARIAYLEFLALWKDADPDIPLLRQARIEAAKLN